MSKIFNVDLNYTTHYEGIEANSEQGAIDIALKRWGKSVPNYTITCVHDPVKHYIHPFSNEKFITFEDAEHDLLANYKEELYTRNWYWEAFVDMVEKRGLDTEILYDLICGSDEYRKDWFNYWEETLDKEVCKSMIEEVEE